MNLRSLLINRSQVSHLHIPNGVSSSSTPAQYKTHQKIDVHATGFTSSPLATMLRLKEQCVLGQQRPGEKMGKGWEKAGVSQEPHEPHEKTHGKYR